MRYNELQALQELFLLESYIYIHIYINIDANIDLCRYGGCKTAQRPGNEHFRDLACPFEMNV